MSNYINIIDFNAIKLGDLSNEIGDYKFAFENYSKVLDRIRNYRGDRTELAMMTNELIKKINEVTKKIGVGISILKFDDWKLTKTSFVKGKQCLKYLYLDKHKKQEKTPISKEKQALFNRGHSFEEIVRNKEFPGGVNVKDKVGNFAYFNSYTRYLISLTDQIIIYEATIIEDEVLVMCDVLIKNENGLIDIYEIKSSIGINEAILNDLSIQYTLAKKRFGIKLNSFNVIFRVDGKDENFTIQNLTNILEGNIEETDIKIKKFKQVLLDAEPNISMGSHCYKPYECEFIDYCKNKC
ncbi:MAG: hypothetical protein KA168_01420 [Chitinophagales bacterium]|nr:hypothetical protein [Chitinophagales bacterium]